MNPEADAATIDGHPAVEMMDELGHTMQITVCANCEELSSILFLSHDRWYCRNCRSAGDAKPAVIPLKKPGRR